jgi:hypothetical protein
MEISDKQLRKILAEEAIKLINEDPELKKKVVERAHKRLRKKTDA